MNTLFYRSLPALVSLVLAGCATCGPGTIETGSKGWKKVYGNSVCLPVGTVSDCTDYQMVEEDGGGWIRERDGGGWIRERDGGGWIVDRDGGGWIRERDEPHHPGDAGDALATIYYVPNGVCRIGVPPLPTTKP